MKLRRAGCYLIFALSIQAIDLFADQAMDIVRKSVTSINTDWAAAPQYDFTERDDTTRSQKHTVKTYQVTMIEGSPYRKLMAVEDKPLSAAQAAEEGRKYQQEVEKRRHESSEAKHKRVAAYERERRQDHALMAEMVNAFDFSLSGEETIDGHRCFALKATPKSSYHPPTRETEVLKGMRGELWVDKGQFQWVKVHAEVFRPVNFGLFLARVKPGTEFTFEQRPVQGNLWLPSHFSMNLNARIFISSRKSSDDERYSEYHRAAEDQAK
jgi:hypothetical protein